MATTAMYREENGKIDSYSTDIHTETIKFNQIWDIISDNKEDYGRYTLEEFYPILEELGISIASEWEVLTGDGPSIICEGRVKDVSNLIRNLQSKEFRNTKQRLKEYVENYESRILAVIKIITICLTIRNNICYLAFSF